MAVTSYKFPTATTTIESPSGVVWTNYTYIMEDDSNFATCGASSKDIDSYYLVGSSFSFSSEDIPDGSTIDGIEVVIDRKITYVGDIGTGKIHDLSLYLQNDSGQVGSNYASASSWPTSVDTATYGGASDMWGTTLSYDDVVASTFGVRLQVRIDVDTSTSLVANVNYIKVRISYTEGSSSSIKTIDGLAKTSVKVIDGLAIASVKTYNNLA